MSFSNFNKVCTSLKIAVYIFPLMFVSSCAITYINDPIDVRDLVRGAELVGLNIPMNKSLMEYTTNSSVPTTLAELVGGSSCKPENNVPLAAAIKAYDPSKPLNEIDLDGNVGWYKGAGLGKAKLYAFAPENTYFYVEAGKPLVLSARSYLGTANGTSASTRSCGPLFIRFQPQPEKRYRYTFVAKGRQCTSRLEEWASDGGFKAIPFESWTCNGAAPVKL